MIVEAIRIWYKNDDEIEVGESKIAFDMDDVEAIEDGRDVFKKTPTTNFKMRSGGSFYAILRFEVALKLYAQNKDYLNFEKKSTNEN